MDEKCKYIFHITHTHIYIYIFNATMTHNLVGKNMYTSSILQVAVSMLHYDQSLARHLFLYLSESISKAVEHDTIYLPYLVFAMMGG